MQQLGQSAFSERPVFHTSVKDFHAVGDIALPSKHSVVLLVSDASGIDSQTISKAAEGLIDSGLVYVCTWGADCERVHDIFDEVDIGGGTIEKEWPIMTTWHNGDSLKDAIDFFLVCAFPFDAHYNTCSYVAIIVGNQALSETVRLGVIESDGFSEK